MPPIPRRQRKFARRNRISTACAACRTRKIKCNRAHPCQNCIANGDLSSCKYEKHERVKEPVISPSKPSEPSTNRASSAPKPYPLWLRFGCAGGTVTTRDSETQSENSQNDYSFTSEQNGTPYRGETHWSTVVRELSPNIGVLPDEAALTTAYSFEGDSSSKNVASLQQDLFGDVPSRKAIDELLKVFFDPSGPAGPSLFILHRPSFLRQYENFWRQPFRAPISWLGLLFSMLYLTTEAYLTYVDGVMTTLETAIISQDQATTYKARAIQCISHVSTQQPTQTLQTMILLSVSGFITQAENSVSSIAAMVRAAVRMGLHRDPVNFPTLSVFEGEMRRRIWSLVRGMDALTSFHLGLPTAIRSNETDTGLPSSLHETDLYEAMLGLPPERPLSEMIDNGYGVVKMRILDIVSKIIEHIHSLADNGEKSDRMHELAKKIQEIRLSLPPHLQFHSWEAAMLGNPYICLQRVQLDVLLHQAICVIYKRYIRNTGDFDVPNALIFKEKCVQSAMALLSHQRNSYDEMQPGRYLQYQRWYGPQPFGDSFFLPAIILCLYLQENCFKSDHSSGRALISSMRKSDLPTSSDVLQTLDTARSIWKAAPKSVPAGRIARILNIVIRHFSHSSFPAIESHKTRPNPSPQSFSVEHDALLHLSDAESRPIGPLVANNVTYSQEISEDVDFLAPDFDWNSLDSYVQGLTGSFEDSIRGIFSAPGFDDL